MNKNICEKSFHDEYQHIKCKETNSLCLYERYCTQDNQWWVSDNYSECKRRQNNMSKKFEKKNKDFIFEKNKNVVQEEKNEIHEEQKNDEVQEKISVKKEKWEVIGHGPTTTTLRKGNQYKIIDRIFEEVGEFIEL